MDTYWEWLTHTFDFVKHNVAYPIVVGIGSIGFNGTMNSYISLRFKLLIAILLSVSVYFYFISHSVKQQEQAIQHFISSSDRELVNYPLEQFARVQSGSSFAKSPSFERLRAALHHQRMVGRLTNKKLKDNFYSFSLLLIATTLFLMVMTYGIFHHYITAPIRSMAERLSRMHEEGTWKESTIDVAYQDLSNAIQYIRRISNRCQVALKAAEREELRNLSVNCISETAGGIAHDFNHFLGVIMGYASLLEENDEIEQNPDSKKSIAAILHAGERASRVAKNLLAFAKKDNADKAYFNLNTAVIEAKEWLEREMTTFTDREIQFELDLANDLADMLADSRQIKQILINLGLNACQAYSQSGQIKIKTNNFRVDENFSGLSSNFSPGDYVHLNITDKGRGIKADNLKKIFEPFFSTKPMGQGSGLGLALVLGIVNTHHGVVTVDSKVGQGTVVNLYFPAVQRPFLDSEDVYEQPISSTRPIPKNKTFLIVDDQEAIRELMLAILEDPSNTFYSAENGEQGLALFREHAAKIDLVISDVKMPVMDGFEMYHALQGISSDLSVLFVSGFADTPDQSILRQENVSLLRKPFDSEAFLDKINQFPVMQS